jgi:hypothetical protein
MIISIKIIPITCKIHNSFVLTPNWSIQVVLTSYKYLLCSNNIGYTISHTFLLDIYLTYVYWSNSSNQN